MKRKRKTEPSHTDQRERPDFITHRKAVLEELSPVTALQRIAADWVVDCSWLVQAELSERQPSEQQSDASISGSAPVSRYYGWDRQSMRDALRFLSDIIRDFAEYPNIRDEWKEGLTKGFGDEFLADLIEWTPPNWDGALLVEHLTKHAATFKRPLPKLPEGATKLVPDANQQKEMVLKLLREKQRHLEDLSQLLDLKANALRPKSSEPALGSFACALQDLQRAVAWFRWLRRHNL